MREENAPGPEFISSRFKVGVLDIDDVEQSIRVDVNCFFYFKPVEPIDFHGGQHVRFENISRPAWVPHFDFENEIEEVICTDESYWYDTKTGMVFGRLNWIPQIQERFDHHPFPFDRQILDVQCLVNNCQQEEWQLNDERDHPVEMMMDHPEYVSQCELNAEADAWNLKMLKTHCLNDDENKSSIVHFQIFLDRVPDYYFWNVVMVYYLIILLKCVIIAFPYTEARFDYAMTLALTTVAFKFVTAELVPRTSYLTMLDKYMLFGLVLLMIRFLCDLGIQLGYTDKLPFGDEGVRADCTEENEISSGFTVCTVDQICTATLALAWTLASSAFGLFILFPNLIRPKWKHLDTMQGMSKNIEVEITGNKTWITKRKRIQYKDLRDAVDHGAKEEATITVVPEE
mmetsp:Transcript_33163/g.40705  ORF Transcript_33163/g.40705 Transcript_33163/m.40705 type:complete len:400 (-) Transcript_33163:143-1342(-)|eukprot:CAMPEP_0204832008 /NCGR_PEP_ID=MMETSP1346-20131115/12438_1 /ASSEMBLY_ACC=CAM_ASM_000771 /TAXON_ID=215587 /ORGANISM="Aplanochytrium stocchinoi, Strain GSBS06" /LENGTH=399 /DNA_ID=CAMNT_0051963537 /DNA_START=45 /DNA_END=1244 /DNA_ORIENTATION=-